MNPYVDTRALWDTIADDLPQSREAKDEIGPAVDERR